MKISVVLEALTYTQTKKKIDVKTFNFSNIFTVDRTQLFVEEDHLTQLSLEFRDIFWGSFTSFDYVLHVSSPTENVYHGQFVYPLISIA